MKRLTGWILERDNSTFYWVNNAWKCSFADRIMPLVTHLGGAVWCIILSLSLLVQTNPFWRGIGIHLAIGLVVCTGLVWLCKKVLPRERPYVRLENVFTGRILMKDPSFPSGHSAAAFCKATILTCAFPDFFMLFYGVALLVACSRVYLGQHYPSDTLIGAMVGSIVAVLVMS
jgi:undecaprenyl-diphosphatase